MYSLHSKLLLVVLAAGTPLVATASLLAFDYVIVGGGTAGLTLANRLSANPSVSVAVIEAGTFPEDVVGNETLVPNYASYFTTQAALTDLDIEWGFVTTPQAGKNGSSIQYPRAKALGGCSTINSMAYCHSSIGAFQLWADTVDDQSYTYENVVQYYQKSMNFTPPDSATRFANATPMYNPADTVTGGPLSVTFATWSEAWSTWVANGMAAIGIQKTDALLNGKLNGSTWQVQTINHTNSFRASAERAFLRPYLGRTNLNIFSHTFAERIIFDGAKDATGVEVTAGNQTFILKANKEVIVSTGVFQSPQLLMVSGIGPSSVLQKYDIDVIADRPGVGQGMNDHIFVFLTYQVNLESLVPTTLQQIDEFNTKAIGPLTNPGGDYVGLEKIPQELRANWSSETKEFLAKLPADWPESQYLVLPESLTGGSPNASYGTAIATLTAPQSRGNVSISSSKMSDPPLINPNWLTAQSDKDILIAGFKRVREFISTSAMSPVIIGQEVFPGPSVQTDAEILAYIEEIFVSISHAHATNQMGTSSNDLAVVDTKGRVYGVNKLRVIDASIFPFLLPGPGPQSHVYMLAEKLAAGIINGD